jgi:transposase
MRRYEKVIELSKAGLSRRAIARATRLSRVTVKKYLAARGFPEISPRPRPSCSLDTYLPYLEEKWASGCRNASQMWREVKECGFEGTEEQVRRTIRAWRSCDGRHESRSGLPGPKPPPIIRAPSPRQAKWLLVREEEELDEKEREMRNKILELCPEAEKARQLVSEFQQMIQKRTVGDFAKWIEKARSSEIVEFVGFANGLEQDRAAVEAALRYEWSNGQLEGQVNRIKAIKRAMYGRANFDLLRRKILRAG